MRTLGIPTKPTIYVSDIHGDIASLEKIKSLPEYNNPNYQVVFGGDYIDGEPYGLEVLKFVYMETLEANRYATMGNHEKLLLSFLDAPYGVDKANYYGNGGKHTLKHMCGDLGYSAIKMASMVKRRYPELIDFLRNLPICVESDNQMFVHAGVDPVLSDYRETKNDDALWIREDYINFPNTTGKVVISGHTPTFLINGHPSCPIEMLDGEPKRYLIDGGEHAMNRHLNVLILNADGSFKKKYVISGENG